MKVINIFLSYDMKKTENKHENQKFVKLRTARQSEVGRT